MPSGLRQYTGAGPRGYAPAAQTRSAARNTVTG